MPRVKFLKNNQYKFIASVKESLNIEWSTLSEVLGISNRTLSDWRREKFLITELAFKKCLALTKGKVKVRSYKLLPDFWSIPKAAKKGGLATARKYGGPGTPEGRRRGGLISQEKRKLHPELYTNCNSRRIISEPKNSIELAEFIGIMLGDGSINSNCTQAVITLNRKDSKNYILFVCGVINRLFSVEPAIYSYKKGSHKNVSDITVHSTSLVDFLKSKGINFSNRSTPLLKFVYRALKSLDFHPKIFVNGVNLYRESEVYWYAREIGFSNLYHKHRLDNFIREKRKSRKGV